MGTKKSKLRNEKLPSSVKSGIEQYSGNFPRYAHYGGGKDDIARLTLNFDTKSFDLSYMCGTHSRRNAYSMYEFGVIDSTTKKNLDQNVCAFFGELEFLENTDGLRVNQTFFLSSFLKTEKISKSLST